MRNYEFEINTENSVIALHMMDKAEKYISRICLPNSKELPHIQIHSPEGMRMDFMNMIENTIQNRFAMVYRPKDHLQGVISIKLHDPYTLVFEVAKLWLEQRIEEVQDTIIKSMGIENDYVDLDWASEQMPEELPEEEN